MDITVARKYEKRGSVKSKLEFPVCGIEKADEFYERFALNTVSEEFTTNLTCKICFSGENAFSLYFDLKYYKENELVFYKRLSDNRLVTGFCIMPEEVFLHPARTEKKHGIDDISDWFFEDGAVKVFKNTFRNGDGKGLRKSAEGKFIVEIIPDTAEIKQSFVKYMLNLIKIQ